MSRFLSQHILSKSRALPIASTTSRIHCRKNFSLLRAVTSETPFCKRLTNCHNAIRSFSAAGGSGFKPWENPVIESDGDYRTETFLEDHIGGPLYENQNDLPRLPIPSIEETLERFLPTALPLAKNEEEVRALREACEAFPEQAKILQERLKRRSEEEMTNTSWLQLWWNQLAYLQYRSSVVVNVSYFFQFKDDPTTKMEEKESTIRRAATLLFATGEYRKSVCSGSLPRETIGKKSIPICSTPFKYLFNACRIPKMIQDSYSIYDPSRYSHAIVARKGHFFSMEIVHPETGEPLPIEALEAQLQECINQADRIPKDEPCLGLLTSTNRDIWTNAREKLLEAGGAKMKSALEMIQSGAVVVNLDEGAPLSRDECCDMLLTGGKTNGKNRWFDKSIQLIVAENGKSGILGEHSMMDGMVMVSYCNHLTNTSYDDAVERSMKLENAPTKIVNIFGNITDTVEATVLDPLVDAATKEFEELISPQANRAQSFHGYGSSYIKKAGHSPDAFVQMAMQLATYRLFGEQVGTYEATQVRPFLHGRTETTRAVSIQSESFIKAMGLRPKGDEGDPTKRRLKLDLLKEATSAHTKYTATAGQALGVDRHFFGLSMLVKDGEKTPVLLDDPVFIRSKTWRLSTSHLTHPNFVNWGFGQVVPDGVGVGYSIHPESCIFNITALKETNWTLKLSDLLEEALLEMKGLIDKEREGEASELT